MNVSEIVNCVQKVKLMLKVSNSVENIKLVWGLTRDTADNWEWSIKGHNSQD